MSAVRPAPAESPPLGVIAPFFLAAPLGLVAAGLLLATSKHIAFVGINVPQTVAITHALVIGWVTTTIMGAVYQLGPAVLGGKLWSVKLARVQFAVHVLAVVVFVASLKDWHVRWIGLGGSLLVLSFVLFVLNAAVAVKRAKGWSLPRLYLAVSLTFVVAAFTLGVTYAGTLEHLWFPITLGRLSAHAHLGLLGWIGLTVMGVSYQLVPMFAVVQKAQPKLGRIALVITSVTLIAFAWLVAIDAGRNVRVVLAAGMAIGPALWAIDQVRLMDARGKRKLDVQGRATYLSVGFLALTIVLGLFAAWGTPFTSDDEPARWLLAYAAAGICGWAGTTLIGNSYKVLPFLIWYHRYLPRVGTGPVPVTGDIYDERTANAVLLAHGATTLVLVAAALSGTLDLLRTGGVLLALVGVAHVFTMSLMFLPKTAGRAMPGAASREVSL